MASRSLPNVHSRPEFYSEEAAFAHLEKTIWGDEVSCPHCGGPERITKVKANRKSASALASGVAATASASSPLRSALCFEHARMPFDKMLQAVYPMTSSKEGVSAHQLHRMLEITYKSAWFLAHLILEAMRSGDLTPFGSGGGVVEVDGSFFARISLISSGP